MNDIEQLIAGLSKDVQPVKPALHPYKLSLQWIGAAALYLLVTLALTGLRPDWHESFVEPWFVAEIATLFALFIVTALSTALLAFPDLHQKRLLAYAPLVPAVLFVAVILSAALADTPPAPLPEHSIECTCSILLTMLLPALWTFYSLRRYASTHYRLAGSIALLSAFSVGALWLRLHEVNDSIAHVVEWHYLPMLGVGLLGLWLGNRLLKW
ncbi:MAG: DUF1109 domain-containing protein [Gammaproteobacteria bacterium]|nr:DUF1109 domain-containing protein [Gammaproteobacteria bacterium]MBU1777299.1 DUF1109 domain-containing protein [Gammaproteobacteria bacterium]